MKVGVCLTLGTVGVVLALGCENSKSKNGPITFPNAGNAATSGGSAATERKCLIDHDMDGYCFELVVPSTTLANWRVGPQTDRRRSPTQPNWRLASSSVACCGNPAP